MRWYTLCRGIESVDSGNGLRRQYIGAMDDSIDLAEIANVKREEVWGYSFWEHIKCILLLKRSYFKIIPLIAEEIKEQREARLDEVREELGILNIGFKAETPFGGPHIDVYAKSPGDVKKQLIEKREAISRYYGVRISDNIDDFVVRRCRCPRSQGFPLGYGIR